MTTRRSLALLVTCALAIAAKGGARDASAWEADTTHAGLTEAAVLGSDLHDELIDRHGLDLGLYQPLTVPPAAAPALIAKLKTLPPVTGVSPDARGKQTALGWLLAGAVVEDIPSERGANHFYDPIRKRGLSERSSGLLGFRFIRGGARAKGKPAPDWILDPQNDLSLGRFWLELELSAVAPTRAEREQHLAYALVVAGALLHVLEDVGSPSRARDDWSSHLADLGAGPADRGSRFERLAALVYGRLGVPQPDAPVRRARIRDFFTADDGKGLADHTAASWWSSGTLPAPLSVAPDARPSEIREKIARGSRFPGPKPAGSVVLGEAPVFDAGGVCLAYTRYGEGTLSFTIPDECAMQQLAVILPTVAAYAQGLLEHLFRGRLEITVVSGNAIVTSKTDLGPGTLRLLAEDQDGNRRELSSTKIEGGKATAPLGSVPSDGTAALVAVYRGVDANGEEIVAIGRAGK